MASDPFVVRANAIARLVVTFGLLLVALFILLRDNFTGDGAKWATGIIGLVIGYWLK